MYTYFQVSDFFKKKASFKIQEVILQLYNPTIKQHFKPVTIADPSKLHLPDSTAPL